MGVPAARRLGRISLTVVAAALLLVGASSAAFAQYPPAADLSVACTPEDPGPLEQVDCTITGSPADIDLHILVEINPTLLDTTVTTDGDGEASFSFDVPADASDGDTITITIEGEEIEGSLVLDLAVSDEEPVEDEDLVRTGSDTGSLMLIGLVAAGLGVGAVVYGRRRVRMRVDA